MSKKTTLHTSSKNLVVVAKTAREELLKLASTLPLDDVSPEESQAARAGNRCPAEAMQIATTVLKTHPDRFPTYDPAIIQSGIAYAQAMEPLGHQVVALGHQILRSVHKRRGDAATQTLSLYQTMKRQNRLSKTDPTRTAVRDMGKLLTVRRKDRLTSVTVEDLKRETKRLKAQKIAENKAAQAAAAASEATQAANAAALAAGTAVVTPVPPAVTAAPIQTTH